MEGIPFVAGSTFLVDAQFNENGLPKSLLGWTVAAEVSYGGSRISSPTVTVTDEAQGRYRLRAEASVTVAWPEGKLELRLRYTSPEGQVIVSEPTLINCDRV